MEGGQEGCSVWKSAATAGDGYIVSSAGGKHIGQAQTRGTVSNFESPQELSTSTITSEGARLAVLGCRCQPVADRQNLISLPCLMGVVSMVPTC
jgi:hypothetical protein